MSVSQEGDRYTVFVFFTDDHTVAMGSDSTAGGCSSTDRIHQNQQQHHYHLARRDVLKAALLFLQAALASGNERKRTLLRERSKHNRNTVRCVGFIGCAPCAAAVAGPHCAQSFGGDSLALHVLYRGLVVDQVEFALRSAGEYLPLHPSSREGIPNLVFASHAAHSILSSLLSIATVSATSHHEGGVPPLGLTLSVQSWSHLCDGTEERKGTSSSLDGVEGSAVRVESSKCLVGALRFPESIEASADSPVASSAVVGIGTQTKGCDDHRNNNKRNASLNPLENYVQQSGSLDAFESYPTVGMTLSGKDSNENIGAFGRWRGVFRDPLVEEQYVRHTQSPLRRNQLLLLGMCAVLYAIVMMFIAWQCSLDHFGLMYEQFVNVFTNSTEESATGVVITHPTELGVKYRMFPPDAFDVLSLRPQSPMLWFVLAAFCGLVICIVVVFSPTTAEATAADIQAEAQDEVGTSSLVFRKVILSGLFLVSVAFCVVGVFCAPVGTLLFNSSSVWVVAMGVMLLIRPPYLSMLRMMLAEAVLFLTFLVREIFFTDRSAQVKFLYLLQIPLAWASFVFFRLLEDRKRRHWYFIFLETTLYQDRIKLQLAEMEQLLKSSAPDEIDAKEMVKRFHRVTERRLEEYARGRRVFASTPSAKGVLLSAGNRGKRIIRRDDGSGSTAVVNADDYTCAEEIDDGTPFLVRPEEYCFAMLSYDSVMPLSESRTNGNHRLNIEAELSEVYDLHRRLTQLASFARCHTRRRKESFYLSVWYSATRREAVVVADSPFVIAWMVRSLCSHNSDNTSAVSVGSASTTRAVAVTAVSSCGNLCGTIAGSSSNGASTFEFMGESIRLSRLVLHQMCFHAQHSSFRHGSVFATERFSRRLLNTSTTLLTRLPMNAATTADGEDSAMLVALVNGVTTNPSSTLVFHRRYYDTYEVPHDMNENEREVFMDELQLLADAMFFLGQGDDVAPP